MKVSYNWLKDYLDFDLTPKELDQVLTDTGLEVEGVEKVESVKGGLEDLVVGRVLSLSDHPNADKLKIAKVDIDTGELLSIVCGAPNIEKSQVVIVAPVDTTIYPTNGKPFKIKKAKIRGEVSEGMICAEDEIGLGTGHEGVVVLPESTEIGIPARDVFKVETDWMLEIGLTPNRADAMSHIGVVRDIYAALKQQDRLDKNTVVKWPSVGNFSVDNESREIPVVVEDKTACPRYCGITISEVEVKGSPEWLKKKLRSIGLNPHNNVVDVTNFVMHELGQPLHAFDADVVGEKVTVKKLPAKTEFVTLDEEKRTLHEDDLMICNGSGGMCIAGVFGGINSGVTEKTTSVFLESAYFDPVHVRKTAKRHGLSTDASFRFERGIDPNITLYALKRAAMLIAEVTGGKISSYPSDSRPEPVLPTEVKMNVSKVFTFVGKRIPESDMESILNSLDIDVVSKDGLDWSLHIAPYRVDVKREADIIEEILRIYGYNEIDIPSKLHTSVSYANEQIDAQKVKETIKQLLTGMGLNEAMSNSLAPSATIGKMPGYDKKRFVSIANPLSRELDILRPDLLYHALEAVSFNTNRKQEDLRLFEIGKGYQKANPYQETEWLSATFTGQQYDETWISEQKPVDLFQVKGIAEAILSRFGLDNEEINTGESDRLSFAYGLSYSKDKQSFLEIGEVDEKTLGLLDIKTPVFYLQLNLDRLLELVKQREITVSELPKYPAVRRDLALLVNKDIAFHDLKETALKQEKKLLKAVDLFDVYEGKNLPEGKKSYALSFILQDLSATLTDERVDGAMEQIHSAFKHKFAAELR